jgi:hypothetical protein
MKWILMLFMLSDKGVVQVKQVKGLPSEQVCQETGKEAQRLDPNHVQSFKCFAGNGAAKK